MDHGVTWRFAASWGILKEPRNREVPTHVPQHDEIRRTRGLLLTLYAALSIAIVAVSLVSYRTYEKSVHEQVGDQLQAIVDLKTTEISAWRAERIGDGDVLMRTPGFGPLVERALNGPDRESARAELLLWLEEVQAADDYSMASLIDASGTRVLSYPSATSTVDPGLASEAAHVMETGDVSIADFHRDGPGAGQVHLSVVVPIADARGGRPIAVVALKVNPYMFLYPYIQQWPGDSASAETLLVERDGTDVLFLNDLRFRDNAALNTRIPLTATNVPAVQAVLGNETVMDGVDYRGVPVVAATKLVPESPWAVVARIDASEVYAPLRTRLFTTVAAGVLVLILGLLGIVLALRIQSSRLLRQELEAEAERAWLAAAIDRSLNEVYVFDAGTMRFTYCNQGAIENTKYPAEELLSMTPLDLLTEFTQGSFDALVAPLIGGKRGMLTFESVHRRKDGSHYPMVSRLQITERTGKRYFIAFTHDISERRAAEEEVKRYQESLELLVAERTGQLQDVNEELAATNEELQAANEETAATNEELAATNEELEVANEELQALYDQTAEAGRELERLNEALALADNAKSDFLASMSHELRTPLNSVIGFSDIMLQGLAGVLNAEQRRQMEMINSSGKHLLSLINDVLDLTKVEAGRMESEQAAFDLSAEVREIVESVRPQADAIGLALSVTGADESDEIVSDARLVRQILFNLLSNAIKFTDQGSVEVSIARRDGVFDITVTDTGPGIARADLERIFEAFTQVRVRDGRPEGTGLGLAVSSRLAALLGGELTVQSEFGTGSAFTLTLPALPQSPERD
ncbi:MAG: hypothetical protein CVT59_02465 [Actinobacteria bacterium HGW-Actinobacteria-1]|nr:MAG: hypothetical protein CVT59_02465 [Actinobacteria bacterium HGW-Actinobacteria-1]